MHTILVCLRERRENAPPACSPAKHAYNTQFEYWATPTFRVQTKSTAIFTLTMNTCGGKINPIPGTITD